MASSPNYIPSSPNKDNHIFRFETDHIYKQNNSYENVTINEIAGNRENFDVRSPLCGSPYENISLQTNNVPVHQSPRTRIKTFLVNKERYSYDIIFNA